MGLDWGSGLVLGLDFGVCRWLQDLMGWFLGFDWVLVCIWDLIWVLVGGFRIGWVSLRLGVGLNSGFRLIGVWTGELGLGFCLGLGSALGWDGLGSGLVDRGS